MAPVTFLVLLLHFTIVPLDATMLYRFLLGVLLIIIGLTIFLFGVDLGVTPIGAHMGNTIAKSNKVWIVAVSGLFLGFFISVAEPDLHILAGQVSQVTSQAIGKSTLVVVVSIGIALMLTLGLFRVIYNKSLRLLFTLLYAVILLLSLFVSPEFLAISFDASGATTGAMTVPFMLALAVGISSLKKGRRSEDDSFGLVGIASTGAILAVMTMSVLKGTGSLSGNLDTQSSPSQSLITPFLETFPVILYEVILALLPILILFIIFQVISFRLDRRHVRRILRGLLYTLVGLVLFLTGVNAGFLDVGQVVGFELAARDGNFFLIAVGFILGFVVILAEPAVHVLTRQIEDVTSGYIRAKIVLGALSIGVGVAVALSMVRILTPALHLWHYLLPGYLLCIGLSYIVPPLFVGMSFDSGGVASGPMTATFILAFAQGAAESIEGASVLIDGFGLIAMVAMTPIIALQILGLVFKVKSVKGGLTPNGK